MEKLQGSTSMQNKNEDKRKKKISDSFSLHSVTMFETKNAIMNMKTSASQGTDELSSKLIKEYAKDLVEFVCVTVNKTISTGTFPGCLKSSIITPIYKGAGLKTEVKSYRPVSNLPTIGKIAESLIEKQMRRYCEKHNLFGHNQFGYRSNRSRITALLKIITNVRENVSRGKIVGVLQLDLSSAFDMLCKNSLNEMLERYGFDELSKCLIKSYLSDRTQQTRTDNILSDTLDVPYGTPQGSCISPLLFAMYLGDMAEVTALDLTTYADDTAVMAIGDSVEEITEKLETQGDKIVDYLSTRKMVANPEKI